MAALTYQRADPFGKNSYRKYKTRDTGNFWGFQSKSLHHKRGCKENKMCHSVNKFWQDGSIVIAMSLIFNFF